MMLSCSNFFYIIEIYNDITYNFKFLFFIEIIDINIWKLLDICILFTKYFLLQFDIVE